ncbi:MAG: M50 family metallopeptidase [Candidatus Methanoperedens sp.]|nr:M50 family metallopeptidase [Candidatus Methanoperedens sp.]MCZ7395536.1 M50 family metallopeptidase [Candidatus Methanoperedens sp.]
MLYLISEYLHRSLSSSASKTLYVVLMLPGTIVHEFSHALVALLMGARITNFSVIPSGDTLGRVEHTNPKIPVIGNFAISIAPLIGCPAILLLISKYLGIHFNYLPGSFDILTETLSLLEGSLSFIMGLDYLNWKTYVFLYLALALGAGAAPSKKDITYMIPGLIIIVVAILALNYFGINIPYLNIIVSWISVALTIAIIPLLTITAMVAMLRLIAVVK